MIKKFKIYFYKKLKVKIYMVLSNNLLNKMQKNRTKKKPKVLKVNRFGDFSIVSKNEGRLELVQISMLKKKLKKFIKKKRNESDTSREKIWYFCRPNFVIQKKSKNSRMGKGKGLIERKVIRIRKNFVIFEIKGVAIYKIKNLVKYMNKFLSIKFFVYCNYSITYNV